MGFDMLERVFTPKIKKLLRPTKLRVLAVNEFLKKQREGIAWDPFATHVPVLLGVSALVRVRRVVEFGCGLYSTHIFLNPSLFPHLQYLHSFDNDSAWANKVRDQVSDKNRFKLTLVSGSISSIVSGVEFSDYDLVFIDDSVTVEERTETISAVASGCSQSNIIVIHDFEQEPYRVAASTLPSRYTIDALVPHTGILWKDAPINVHKLERLNALIDRRRRRLGPQKLRRWSSYITRGLKK